MKENKMKACTSILTLILLFSVLVVPISIVRPDTVQNDGIKSAHSSTLSKSTMDTDVPDISVKIGQISLSIFMIVPNRETVIIFESNSATSTVEYKVEPSNNKYRTSIILDGVLLSENELDENILAPVERNELEEISPIAINTLAAEEIQQPLTADYTYKWWDGVR
jgi:hypothetical protein